MATATPISAGASIPHTPGSALALGEVVPLTTIIGVALQPIAAAEAGNLAVEGVFDLPKEATAVTFAQGAAVYWDVADDECNATASGNLAIGYAWAAAGATDATVRVKLVQ